VVIASDETIETKPSELPYELVVVESAEFPPRIMERHQIHQGCCCCEDGRDEGLRKVLVKE
jgi:hypothetical protein